MTAAEEARRQADPGAEEEGAGASGERARPGPPADPFRDPLYVALVDTVAERGYKEATMAEVIERAGADRAAVEARFAAKEDLVLVAFGAFVDDFIWQVRTAFDSAEDWLGGIRAAAYAAADWLEQNPRTARFGTLDVLAAEGELIRVRREGAFIYCGRLIERGRAAAPDPGAVPAGASMMAIGSIAEILTRRLGEGSDPEPERMVRAMLYTAVRPYLGEQIARAELTAPRPRLPDFARLR